MQGTKVVVCVLAVSLAATALMFGVASVIRANGGSSNVVVDRFDVGRSVGRSVTRTGYRRMCSRDEWVGYTDLYAATLIANDNLGDDIADLRRGTTRNRLDIVKERMAANLEQVAILQVLKGESWWSMSPLDWPSGMTAPTRKQLAETTRHCVRNLTEPARRWIALANVR